MYLKTLSILTVSFLSLLFLVMATFMPAATTLVASSDNDPETKCLAQAVYFEARGEPFSGQVAVAQVVHNRVAAKGTSYCKVVFEGSSRRNACQFSFACDGKSDTATDQVSWQRALMVASLVRGGNMRDLSGDATFYHANYVSPTWSKSLKVTANIGNHIFYRQM
ncbi:cell wall hydrolase [Sneathiella sp. CAU 1612]|uniref:Cell wall hydrolase n=1 Tax=Sneathiella sedimenti TaxID=2816034 RepID=A0ABS3F9N9_9PROT|nr:cell wall hydrolase [Sneathiella sedimenti]MBO0335109.1 cell wall hydrolase [Sneathiella sedimenti]